MRRVIPILMILVVGGFFMLTMTDFGITAEKPKGQKTTGTSTFTHDVAQANQAETSSTVWTITGLDNFSSFKGRFACLFYSGDSVGGAAEDSLADTTDDSVKVLGYTGSETGFFSDSDAVPFWTSTVAIVDSGYSIINWDFSDSTIWDKAWFKVVTLVDDTAICKTDSTVVYQVKLEAYAR